MSTSPAVSIIIPTYNAEAWISAALESCVQQTLAEIEIICVDDASTDETAAVIEGFCARDSRVRLLRLQENCSAFQARRVGVEAATAPYILFLDGDDELTSDTARIALERAAETAADVVGFGVEVVMPAGARPPAFEAALQPTHDELSGAAILESLFPVGEPVHGHIWGYLFRTELVRSVYAGFAPEVRLYRTNDLPITFLALAQASSYASVRDRLYRHHDRRGRSDDRATSVDEFAFSLGAVDSMDLIEPEVRRLTTRPAGTTSALDCFSSARLSIIGGLLNYCLGAFDSTLQDVCLARMRERVGDVDLLRACAASAPKALGMLVRSAQHQPMDRSHVRHVLLIAGDLLTGGVQSVTASQARYLVDAGFTVTIAVHHSGDSVYTLPSGVAVVQIEGEKLAARLESWNDICRETGADVIIDHHILYMRDWPFLALMARTQGIPTIGWLHSFALRPLLDDNTTNSFLVENLPLLDTVVTLSPTDVAYWKLRGVDRVVWLPNPPSPLQREIPARIEPKQRATAPFKLVWWGRLHQSVKQVRTLIPLAAALRARGIDAELTIIGPDTKDLTADQLHSDAVTHGVADIVHLPGALHGEELISALSEADLYVSTGVIEGYLFALVEAQAIGLPVAMFELPWLTPLVGNKGVIAVPQDDLQALARVIADLSADPDRYSAMSVASLAAARRALSFDYPLLYAQLLSGDLDAEYSPDPSASHVELLFSWVTFYAERNARRRAGQRTQVTRLERQITKFEEKITSLETEAAADRRQLGIKVTALETEADALRKKLRIARRRVVAQEQTISDLQGGLSPGDSPRVRPGLLRRLLDALSNGS